MNLKLGGKPFKLQKNNIGTRTQQYLDALTPKEILTSQELARALNVSHGSLKNQAGDPILFPYKQLISFETTRKLVWGNPKAIQELRRQLEAN